MIDRLIYSVNLKIENKNVTVDVYNIYFEIKCKKKKIKENLIIFLENLDEPLEQLSAQDLKEIIMLEYGS